MELIKRTVNVDFIGKRYIAFAISGLLILISIISFIAHKGPRLGIDFSGGTLIQIKFNSPVEINNIKSGLDSIGFSKASVQRFGEQKENEFLVRTDAQITATRDFSESLGQALKSATRQNADIRRVEIVGPQVGRDLKEKALYSIFYAMLLIAIYISGRFELKWMLSGITAAVLIGALYLFSLFKINTSILIGIALLVTFIIFWLLKLKYAMAALVALVHDTTITVGLFSILDKEFNLTIIAAVLTLIGYSLNDTVVVFDRIRENLTKYKKSSFSEVINKSVNETLSRTLVTAGITFIVVLSLFIFGGEIIHDFTFVLLVGIVIGTYSSVYVANPILIAWQDNTKGKTKSKLKR